MNIKERYIHAVVNRLPLKQQAEIAKEVELLIDDMMETAEGSTDKERLVKVLTALGEPGALADKYRDQTRYLIGPKYFSDYIYTLKLVLVIVLAACSVSIVLGLFFEDDYVKSIAGYLSTLIQAAAQTFCWITLIFAFFEYKQVDLRENKVFNPEKLPPVPNELAKISRGETIVGIIFTAGFLVLFYSELFAIFVPSGEGGLMTIPIFRYEAFKTFKFTVVFICLLGIAKEVVKLIYGSWNKRLAIILTILTVIATTLFVAIFGNINVWNTNLIADLASAYDFPEPQLTKGFGYIVRIIAGLGIIGGLIDIGITLYKGYKHDRKAV